MDSTNQEVANTAGVTDAKTTTPSPVPEATQETSAPPTQAATGEATKEMVAAAYAPNFKFKSMGSEHEIDEWARPLIKDQETEKKFKELYEKSYGLDHFKTKHETVSKELDQYKQNYTALYNDAAEALSFAREGDLDSFFDRVNVSKEKVYEWVLGKLERQNLPPEQRRVYDEFDAQKRKSRESETSYSRQIAESEKRYQQVATQAREAEVNWVLARPEISQIVQNYDAKNGDGSFKAFVAEYGVMHFNAYGEDPSAEQAVSAVLKRLGDAYKSMPAPMAAPTASGEKPLPVIPNVSGKNISPVRKTPKSIDDIRKFAAEMRE